MTNLNAEALQDSPDEHSVQLSTSQVLHARSEDVSVSVVLQFVLHLQLTFKKKKKSR